MREKWQLFELIQKQDDQLWKFMLFDEVWRQIEQ